MNPNIRQDRTPSRGLNNEHPRPGVVEYQGGVRSAAFIYDKPGQEIRLDTSPLNTTSDILVSHPEVKARCCTRLFATIDGNDYSILRGEGEKGVIFRAKELRTGTLVKVEVPFDSPDLTISVGNELSIGTLRLGRVQKMVAVDGTQRFDNTYASGWEKVTVPYAPSEEGRY